MTHTVTVTLSSEVWQWARRGALASRKPVEEFISDRLNDTILPQRADLLVHGDEELKKLEQLDDKGLREIAHSQLSPERQQLYSQLLEKNSQGVLIPQEKILLHQVGDEARRLTLKKSHAVMLLQWRGIDVAEFKLVDDDE